MAQFHLYQFNSDNFLDKKDNLIKKGLTKNNAIGRIEETFLFSINHILITNERGKGYVRARSKRIRSPWRNARSP